MKFPIKAKLKNSKTISNLSYVGTIVLFDSLNSGTVINAGNGGYTIGRRSNNWADCDDKTIWEILPDETINNNISLKLNIISSKGINKNNLRKLAKRIGEAVYLEYGDACVDIVVDDIFETFEKGEKIKSKNLP